MQFWFVTMFRNTLSLPHSCRIYQLPLYYDYVVDNQKKYHNAIRLKHIYLDHQIQSIVTDLYSYLHPHVSTGQPHSAFHKMHEIVHDVTIPMLKITKWRIPKCFRVRWNLHIATDDVGRINSNHKQTFVSLLFHYFNTELWAFDSTE
jgi:hypothetical protein